MILRGAPAVIVAHAEKNDRTASAACTIALAYMELAAISMGLGTCWVGLGTSLLDPELLDRMGMPGTHKIVAPIILGHPKGIPAIPERMAPDIVKIVT